ncbi:MAG: class III extradiol dioxygenase subunit B-like domain-containing protein [bacterium]|nr:class III extradiol dioxygenase subunit B-like domain-containing protein [bacterium]
MLVFACISPHPPIILPDVGSPSDRKKVEKTIVALESLAPKLAATKPEVIIISSPHPDWGINVPLHFLLMADSKWQIVKDPEAIRHTSYAIYPILTILDSPRQHYEWGKQLLKGLPPAKRWAWIASGDMSHRLRVDGPYGFHPKGPKFDQKFIELLKSKDVEGILNLDPNLVEEADECGLRSFCMLLGLLETAGIPWESEILSYEGPFGVGYLVANFKLNDD